MNVDEKKLEIEAFLLKKEAAKRSKLEHTIAGKVKFREYIGPAVFTALSLGLLIPVLITHSLDGSYPVGALIVITIVGNSVIWWSNLNSIIIHRRFLALKEYVDLRLAEKNDPAE